jgi:[protein-PII] uridylyltransferase
MTKPPRSRRRQRTGGPLLLALDEGVGQHEGEVVLMPDARPERDAVLGLRAAAVAADRELVLSPAVCARLASSAADLPEPWPGEARRLLCALLGAGHGLLEVWEALDQAGYISRILPEWDAVRFRPPQSAIHRFTVDRHLLETCVEASAMVRDVRRPDLLLVAALLHDLGKALDGDHSVTGAGIAARVARRIGFSEADADTITLLVRQHLMLAQVATRRDLEDPMTVDMVVGIVRNTETLDLLEALTYADARAAGPAASSPWRMRLVGELCRRVRSELAGGGESMWTEAPPVQGGRCWAAGCDSDRSPRRPAGQRRRTRSSRHAVDRGRCARGGAAGRTVCGHHVRRRAGHLAVDRRRIASRSGAAA